jgi:dTDP-4-amino-4,6-dideoxygalactose transaminase
LERAVKDRISKGKKPKAIIAVHLYGMPFKVKEITTIAKKYEIPLLEDSAEALGSKYDNVKCGSFGELAVLSFNGSKIITTSGGGAIVCNTERQKNLALHLATQAKDDAPHYEHTKIGYNYRLSNISAGIGCGQMEVLGERIHLRREMNNFYSSLFDSMDGFSIFREPSEKYLSNHWLSCITVDLEKTAYTIQQMRHAFAEGNIESRPLWKPMHLQPVFAEAPYYGANISEKIFKSGLCLPSSSNLTEEEKLRIQNVIQKFV